MNIRFVYLLLAAVVAVGACDGSSSIGLPAPPPPPPAPIVSVDVDVKQLIFSWTDVPGATSYRLFEDSDGQSGFTQVGADIPAGTLSARLAVAVHLHDFANALYIVEACNITGCSASNEVNAMTEMLGAIGYFKASNNDPDDRFGDAVALSADGSTLAVGARLESSNGTGVGGDESDNSAINSGAVYIFRFDGTAWFQEAFVKASNTDPDDSFGMAIALSADGDTLAVGAAFEDSNTTGINGDQNDDSADDAGAVYLFRFDGTDWSQQAYIKASNTDAGDQFGWPVALSADGNTMAIGAPTEDSSATGIDGDQSDNLAPSSGAVYLYRFDGTDWSQQAFVKASNAEGNDVFGESVALSSDGDTLAVGAADEDSNATGVDGDQNNNLSFGSGAVYLFRFDGMDWSQQAYVKASNSDVPGPRPSSASFGIAVTLGGDGNTLAVGAPNEESSATGINGDQNDISASSSGAAYLFRFDGATWSQQVYIKASNTEEADLFGREIALSADGSTLAVGAPLEDSSATGIDGDQNDNSAPSSGAVYLFRFDGTDWSQRAYVKASNTESDGLGWAVALSADGNTLAAGATDEDSNATGINGDQSDNSATDSGAVYVY